MTDGFRTEDCRTEDCVETSQRHLGEDNGETHGDSRSRQKRLLFVGAAAAVTAVSLVLTLVLNLALSAPQKAAPSEDQTLSMFREEQLKELQQCCDLTLMPSAQDSRCCLCPDDWLWWNSHCYYFSPGLQENRQWSGSVAFCQQHNSSLLVINDSAEMDFLQRLMTKFPRLPFLWVGLSDLQQEGRWLWGDGTDVQRHLPLAVQWDADDRDCADLRGGGSLFAAECDAYGPWACKRES